MDIIAITGGLGNQMFQYALGLMLKHNGYSIKLDVSKYKYYQIHNNYELESVFGINEKHASVFDRMRLGYIRDNRLTRWMLSTAFAKKSIICESDKGFEAGILTLDNRYYKGYWQNESYFLEVGKEVRDAYRFKDFDRPELVELADEISSCESVSMHIRRGDYLTTPLYMGICDIDYYIRALEVIKDKVKKDISIYAFSNDAEWVRSNFDGFNVTVVDINHGEQSYRDMQLMSLCKHNIIANSSFSWWGAWLNNHEDKIVIAPKKWVNSDKEVFNGIVPERWIKV